jgi:putative ABC transport system substrate-binding protein
MKKFIWIILLMLSITGATASAEERAYRISVSQFVEHPALDAVRQGFQDYMAEKQLKVDYSVHNAQGNMATAGQIAAQVMGESPDLILAIATPTSQAMAQALKKSPRMQRTPFLFTAVTDPVKAGLVKDLHQPGGNTTGVSDLLPVDEHMGLVRAFFPELKHLGVLYNAGEANSKATVEQIREAGQRMGFEVVTATVSKSSDVYQAAGSLVGRVEAIFIPTDNTVVSALESAVKVCIQNQMPLFCADIDSVARGAVAAMGFDYYQHGYQTAAMAEKILAGADPGEMPVETQKILKLHLNLEFARKMGVLVPDPVLSKADKVYE